VGRTAAAELGDTPTTRKLRADIRTNSAAPRRHTEAADQNRRRNRKRPVTPTTAARPTAEQRSTPALRPALAVEPPTTARIRLDRDEARQAAREAVERVNSKAVDLGAMSDEDLNAYLTHATDAEDFDAMDAIICELEHREAAAAKT
jgi:hypothetical protein